MFFKNGFEALRCGVCCALLKKSKSFLYRPHAMPYFVGFARFLPIFARGEKWG
ncbi:hypothetical protein MNB_SV-14-1022 [hydrothermal vent metagenome]|uniref:Uncharacterized protein n=1 Tax=hydrothermal vent metagenome TaxID=652676 RepID=A0A1W1CCH2_9ZZZZ